MSPATMMPDPLAVTSMGAGTLGRHTLGCPIRPAVFGVGCILPPIIIAPTLRGVAESLAC